MSSPVPMPTARQAELQDRFTQYLRLEREVHPLEVLKAAKALVKEEGLNPYHAAQLHMKLSDVPEIGLYHTTEGVKILTQLRETDDSRNITEQLQEATKIMLKKQKEEKTRMDGTNGMGIETEEPSPLEPSPPGFDYPVKKGRTAGSGGEEEDMEKKLVEDLYDDTWTFLTS
ncbi:hypothetical protein FPHYL_635 [Fusarium phyllophilum]|uniref:Uncharacterized protein n=1 Tax=Fusarium phyllophilum TaxID=47803 RepID=A0A8H5NMK6_9HYPO|nr:hypothetical protein FPHYL_635 [Fusarium phyllophilum]